MKENKIVFFGTTYYALECLKHLINNKFNIVAVVTLPDDKEKEPIKQYSIDNKIPVLQPEKLDSGDFISNLWSFKPDIQLVIAFKLLPEIVWKGPQFTNFSGTYNLHPSLLPQYKGAAPITWALINEQTKTGVTIFKINEKIDSGEICTQKEVEILPDETFYTLQDKLINLSKIMLVDFITNISFYKVRLEKYNIYKEDNSKSSLLAPKITAEIRAIDWTKSSKEIYNLIKALPDEEAATTYIRLKNSRPLCKIFKARICNGSLADNVPIGWHIVKDKKLCFRTGDSTSYIEVLELQVSGKKRIEANNFINGLVNQ